MAVTAQNTKLYVKNEADTDYLEVGCIQSIGDIDFGSREIIEIDCLSNTDTDKVLGTFKLASIDLTYTYNELEPDGNGKIKDAFESEQTVKLDIRIELPNKKTTDGNGTRYEFKAIVPSYKIVDISKNNYIKSSTTLAMTTKPVVTASA